MKMLHRKQKIPVEVLYLLLMINFTKTSKTEEVTKLQSNIQEEGAWKLSERKGESLSGQYVKSEIILFVYMILY